MLGRHGFLDRLSEGHACQLFHGIDYFGLLLWTAANLIFVVPVRIRGSMILSCGRVVVSFSSFCVVGGGTSHHAHGKRRGLMEAIGEGCQDCQCSYFVG